MPDQSYGSLMPTEHNPDVGVAASPDAISGDPTRQAVAALRGYSYQLYASALAWLTLGDGEILHLEVAEDYAIAAANAISGVQVKYSAGSGPLTIRTSGVAAALNGFVDLIDRNPGRRVELRYLTTSPLGTERARADRIDGGPALDYWRRAAAGAPVGPLRALLGKLPLKPRTREYLNSLDDNALRLGVLRHIRWDAGRPSAEQIDIDLEDGAAEFLASQLGAASTQAGLLADLMVTHVLKTATSKQNRQLRRAHLLKLGDQLTQIILPRGLFDELAGGAAAGQSRRQSIVQQGEVAPSALPMVPRDDLMDEIQAGLGLHQTVFVTASTGLGKTSVAERAAQRTGLAWLFADVRDLDPRATLDRLGRIASELAVASAPLLLLDDLAHLDDPGVITALNKIVRTLRRRDGALIITAAVAPTRVSASRICGGDTSTISVPYLSLDEVRALIRLSVGNERWANNVHRAASGGHPQLVQAALLHLKSEGWSHGALMDLVRGASPDVAAEQGAASQRMVNAMPERARDLLLRLSLIYNRFDRAMAMIVGEAPPPISVPGAELDRLIGPWIETLANGAFRVSPLIANSGKNALGPAQQRAVHQAIAHGLLSMARPSVMDSDPIFYHAKEGGDRKQLFAFAHSVITASESILENLADLSPLFLYQPTDQPLGADPTLASLLRLAQLLVANAGRKHEMSAAIWAAMRSETDEFKDDPSFELVVLPKLLVQSPIANWMPDWIDLILRLDALAQDSELLKGSFDSLEQDPAFAKHPIAFLFLNQAMGISSPGELLALAHRLDRVEPVLRARLLGAFAAAPGDFSLLVNRAWMSWVRADDAEFEQGAAQFREAAVLAARWGEAIMATRCEIGAAIIIDEYIGDPDRALGLLESIAAGATNESILIRAKAKIHWRRNDHASALALFDRWWVGDGSADFVERAYAAREAATSSAALSQWQVAAGWFERARSEAAKVGHPDMQVMATGLLADQAQMLFLAGKAKASIDSFGAALEELRSIDPARSKQAGHCHRVIMHAILWLEGQTGANVAEITDLPPGSCSNPNPHPDIGSRPLAPIDLGWYMLADAARACGADPDLFRSVNDHLADGPMLAFELTRPMRLAEMAIADDDVQALVDLLAPFASALHYLRQRPPAIVEDGVPVFERGSLACAALDGDAEPALVETAGQLLLAFAMKLALTGKAELLQDLKKEVIGRAPGLATLARVMTGGEAVQESDLLMIARTIHESASLDPSQLEALLRITGQLALFARRHELKPALGPVLEQWSIERWTAALRDHRFRFRNPPEVDRSLGKAFSEDRPPLARVAAIVLAASGGFSATFYDQVLAAFREMRDGQA